ncbi:AraC-like DNA-binding protein [Luteibacter jiangsuensis]|uniref:AraC-like DNA-binding protein n=1 Tax=Luteibacter jiangsuensis TaxID=637577 RepID=A0ABT9T2T7_9GAMM|nr:AraC family transcriptional regulator [Luteibacter jiangsuensis]MDQ0011570.1 AraC-like DNA-binding protein [Luteibacter jiangsuensis]
MSQPGSIEVRRARMVDLITRLAPSEGYTLSAVDGVAFMRSSRPLVRTPALYEPSIVIVAQGRKRGFHGGQTYVYDAQHYLALAVPLPFEIETEASAEEPMLGVTIRIDLATTAELALAVDDLRPQAEVRPATLFATPLDDRLGDAALRLLEVLSDPVEARLLAPGIVREITYRVLTGEQGGGLRAALTQGGHFGRIAKALRRIHAEYARPLDVATLASEANMSVPTFHTHFKAVTTTSPIQYIKAMRLHHARLLMVRRGLSAATASERVGYESASQFSREFKRLFGRSPVDETRQLKDLLDLAPSVRHVSPARHALVS